MSEIKGKFDCLPGGLLITDLESRAVYANVAVEKRSGFAVAEIIGKRPGELWGGQMDRQFYQSLWHTIGVKQKPFVSRIKNKRKSGELISEMLHIAPLKDSLGAVRYFIELHPNFKNQDEAVAFGDSFIQRTNNWHRDEKVWEWVRMSLSGIPGDASRYPKDLLTTIEEEFIIPTRKIFARRFEDAPLIEKAKQCPEAFDALYIKYRFTIHSYFLHRLSDPALSEDFTQEVFARAFRYLPDFRVTNASYLTYLLHICHSVLVNYYRKESRAPILLPIETIEETILETKESAPDIAETILRTLNPTEKKVMLLMYQDGFRAKEIAEQLGKTENAVKLILSRSRKKLRTA
ncbi:sigma-70 family RNA polymerase sigma factor [Candidatus Gracilibacteria bacterium]|nr:sigma-70 family RNA polymerase sigma factor [Candidatus Gracilibacteria bacterium]